MKKVILLMIVLCFMVTGCGNTTNEEMNEMIAVSEVKEIIDNYGDYSNLYIVDVREKDEYESGHLENAINIPLSVLEAIDLDKDARIIVYCQSGGRSSNARSILENLGYTDVVDMGGINDWPYEIIEN